MLEYLIFKLHYREFYQIFWNIFLKNVSGHIYILSTYFEDTQFINRLLDTRASITRVFSRLFEIFFASNILSHYSRFLEHFKVKASVSREARNHELKPKSRSSEGCNPQVHGENHQMTYHETIPPVTHLHCGRKYHSEYFTFQYYFEGNYRRLLSKRATIIPNTTEITSNSTETQIFEPSRKEPKLKYRSWRWQSS